ncbi:FadR/GntR family transcriptional regulator [Streptomyces mirabilis]|uniref:FadR/GntR family transcriptional regulator n=1 Tax=Streptomyces mirabilis TaxID=68239 RepID=UPI00369D81B8
MNLSDRRTCGGAPRHLSAMEMVLRDLRSAIERGDLAVGEKLPSESKLTRFYGCSRSVVREALRALQALGLTAPRRGRGTFVTSSRTVRNPTFGAYSARDLLEVRRHVEIPVAGYAAVRRTPEDVDHLERLLSRMERETDTTAWVAMDTLSHIGITQVAVNPVFRRGIEEISDALAKQSTFLTWFGDRRAQSNREHKAIVEAIVDGSEGAAVQAMACHLENVETHLTTIVQNSRTNQQPKDGWNA